MCLADSEPILEIIVIVFPAEQAAKIGRLGYFQPGYYILVGKEPLDFGKFFEISVETINKIADVFFHHRCKFGKYFCVVGAEPDKLFSSIPFFFRYDFHTAVP